MVLVWLAGEGNMTVYCFRYRRRCRFVPCTGPTEKVMGQCNTHSCADCYRRSDKGTSYLGLVNTTYNGIPVIMLSVQYNVRYYFNLACFSVCKTCHWRYKHGQMQVGLVNVIEMFCLSDIWAKLEISMLKALLSHSWSGLWSWAFM